MVFVSHLCMLKQAQARFKPISKDEPSLKDSNKNSLSIRGANVIN